MINSRNNTQPSQRACLCCRQKHLKCDGQEPICMRCARNRIPCKYVQSRRGYKGDGRSNALDTPAISQLLHSNAVTVQESSSLPVETESQVRDGPDSSCGETISLSRAESDDVVDDKLIGLFYRNIHPAHPFILPYSMYQENRNILPTHLRNAMCFIASHHSSESSDIYREKMNLVFDPSVSEDGFKVQSLLLLTLASYARFERDQGNRALTTAIDLALWIGLNTNSFANNKDPIIQESWRRTWWELYTITGLISLIGGMNKILVHPNHMALPTHCEEYNKCQILRSRTSEEMQQRFSMDDNFKWSSFAYRIEAMRILRNILDIADDATGPKCGAANASISSYLLSVPPEKRDGMKEDGEVDEVMSCSLMIIHLASISLHFPRSNLADVCGLKTVCGTAREKITVDESRFHRAAALRSATALSNLISSRSTLRTLSPCFSCAIAFASVVHISECFHVKAPESNDLKEHVQLQLSALNEIGQIWPIARVVRGQIAQFFRELFNKAPLRDTFPESAPPFELPNLDEQWVQGLMTEDLEFAPEGFFMPGLS